MPEEMVEVVAVTKKETRKKPISRSVLIIGIGLDEVLAVNTVGVVAVAAEVSLLLLLGKTFTFSFSSNNALIAESMESRNARLDRTSTGSSLSSAIVLSS